MSHDHDNRHNIPTNGGHGCNRPSRTYGSSRRQFLTTLAVFGTSAVLPTELVEAQTPATRTQPLIDLHHPIFPPAFRAAANDSFSTPKSRAASVRVDASRGARPDGR